ncbi:MAG: PDZ domain-containing protein [Tepidisphaerales bacterium]
MFRPSLFHLLILAASCSALAAPQTQPATRPADEEMLRLVVQLGDPVVDRREQAQVLLRRIGKPALPLLIEAAKAGDPEIASRAARLVKVIQRPPVPGGPLANETFRSIITGNDVSGRTIEASTPSRNFRLRQSDNGVELSVRATQDGREVTEDYEARSLEELEKDSPDAHAICQRLIRDAATVTVNGRVVVIGPNAGLIAQDPLDVFKETLDLQMQRQRIAPEKRRGILDELSKLQRLRERQPQEDDASRDKRLKQYFEGSDALRQKLDELKLDPGEFLPPPAKARLGIQCQTTRDGAGQWRLMVEVVVPGSRAAAMQLHPGDTILKANAQDISDIMDLRTVLAESKEPLRIDILRDDKPLVIQERKAADDRKP